MSKPEPTIQLPVSKLRVGLYVDLKLKWSEHPFLFRRFRIRTEDEILVIRRLIPDKVTVYPKRSIVGKEAFLAENTGPEAAGEATPEKSGEELWKEKRAHIEQARKYRDERRRLMREYKETAQRVQRFTNDLSQAPANAMRDAGEIIGDMVSHFEQGESVLMNLVNLPDAGYSSYAHSLNVTVLSLSLARGLGLSGDELHQIAMGALLHDIGHVALPGKITLKSRPLTSSEEKVYQTHPLTGAKMARHAESLDENVIEIIEKHHQMLDGTGYPFNNIKPEAISRATRIVSIANLYDNLCNPRQADKALTPKQAMATLYKKYQGKLDPKLLPFFIKCMGVYPPGTVVKLSDSSLGLVITVDPDNLLKPQVLVYNPDIPRNEALMLDLVQRDDITVEDAVKPDDYPSRLYEYLGMKERLGYFYSKGRGGP